LTNISLIGFMGSGKTTVGRLLANRLKFNFIDIDRVVEDRAGMKIWKIFEKYGEEYFRILESQVIKEVLGMANNTVIACGGGVVLREDNVNTLRKNSIVVYLRISVDEAYKRLKDCSDRPLLSIDDKLIAISKLLRIREPLYLRAADKVVDVDGKTPEEVVDCIIKLLPADVIRNVRTC